MDATHGVLPSYFIWPAGNPGRFMGKTFNLAGVFGGTTHVLLGRRDFFVHFDLTFDEKSSIFTITAVESVGSRW